MKQATRGLTWEDTDTDDMDGSGVVPAGILWNNCRIAVSF